jgi:hypothetical protein
LLLIETKRHVLCHRERASCVVSCERLCACALVLWCRHTSRLLWSELTAPSNSIFNASQRCDEGRSLPTPKTMRGGTSRGHVSAARNTVCTVSTTVAFASRCIICIRCDGMYQIIYGAPHAQTCTHKLTNRHRHAPQKGREGGGEQQECSKAQRLRHAAKAEAGSKALALP